MAFHNPEGRANYEPNSWESDGGPREDRQRGFKSFPEEIDAPKSRMRSETFADHYSQARQFYLSQTETEQGHIAAAFTFELSKVETPAIRARMVSHLLNIDEGLAKKVAEGLRLKEMPEPAEAAKPTKDLENSPKLSILLNGPDSFKGRKIGVLVTDGTDIELLNALKNAAREEGAMVEIVAPMVGGVEASDGRWVEAKQKVDGGPSILYDAVAVLPSADGASLLSTLPPARDFVSDAFAHMKFIFCTEEAGTLFESAGITAEMMDDGFVECAAEDDAGKFIEKCRGLRYWKRNT